MRILHVTPFYEPAWAYGGMTRCSAALCRALASNGHDVTVVTALLDPSHSVEERLGGVRVRRFPGPRLLSRFLVPWGRGLRGFLRGESHVPDVAHLHGHRNGLAIVARDELRRLGVPWVLLPNGTYPHHAQRRLAKAVFDLLWGRRIVEGAAKLVAVSEAEAHELPRPARVIPNGVEAPSLPAEGRAQADRRLLFVGTDRPQKRGRSLLELLASLPDARLTLVGRFGASFRRLFAPFADRVSFAGVVAAREMGAFYAGSDLLVHPAEGEAFGLAPFEAALCGTPAVVAGGHGCGEWFARAGGSVVSAGDDPGLAAAARARLDDPALGAAEAAAVADFARRELNWTQVARAMEDVYADAIAAARGARA